MTYFTWISFTMACCWLIIAEIDTHLNNTIVLGKIYSEQKHMQL